MGKSMRQKLQDSMKRMDGSFDDFSKVSGPKDLNNQKMFKAIDGYSDKKVTGSDRPSLSSLPYHHMGLPNDEVEIVDKFFQEQRDKQDARAVKEKEDQELYEKIKQE